MGCLSFSPAFLVTFERESGDGVGSRELDPVMERIDLG